jgi:polyhydroxybutyrate depolymerase
MKNKRAAVLFMCLLGLGMSVHPVQAETLREKIIKKSIERNPMIGLGGKDYRWEVAWITGPGSYSPGNWGRKITWQNAERFYQFHVPAAYKKGTPVPVVLVFHGGGGYPGAVRYQVEDIEKIADRENFIVVYPAGHAYENNGIKFSDRLLQWNDGRPSDEGVMSTADDVGFVNGLLDDLAVFFSIDQQRIYACGISNGAQFTNRLAQQLSNRIAAIACVAGHRKADDYFPPPPRAVAKLQFSGMQDELAPYHGGTPPKKKAGIKIAFKFTLPPVEDTIASWAKHDGCPAEPAETKRIGKAVMKRYGPGRDNTEVVLWTLEDGGHTWPGGQMVVSEVKADLGNINRDISAVELMWEFFKNHKTPDQRGN